MTVEEDKKITKSLPPGYIYEAKLKRPAGLSSEAWYRLAGKAPVALRRATTDLNAVDTGELRAGWGKEVKGKVYRDAPIKPGPRSVAIPNPVPHTAYVVQGTPKMKGRNIVGKAQTLFDIFASKDKAAAKGSWKKRP